MGFNTRIVSINNRQTAKKFLNETGASTGGLRLMEPKALFFTVMVENLSDPAAHILKQEMLSKGGECAIHRDVLINKAGNSSALLMGTLKQFKNLITKLKAQQFGLPRLSQELEIP